MQRYAIAGADICEEHQDGKWVLYSDAQATISRLSAERDQARAEAASAYERAAQVADTCEMQNAGRTGDYHKGLSSGGQAIAAGIRALDPATPSSAPASVAEAAKVLLDWWNQEEGSSLDARKVVKVCQGLRSSDEDWVRFDAALRAISEESK